MSGPTYRIDRVHTPGEAWTWAARIFRLSDASVPVCVKYGESVTQVTAAAQEWVAEQNVKQETTSLYVDDDGQLVEAHSVKA